MVLFLLLFTKVLIKKKSTLLRSVSLILNDWYVLILYLWQSTQKLCSVQWEEPSFEQVTSSLWTCFLTWKTAAAQFLTQGSFTWGEWNQAPAVLSPAPGSADMHLWDSMLCMISTSQLSKWMSFLATCTVPIYSVVTLRTMSPHPHCWSYFH